MTAASRSGASSAVTVKNGEPASEPVIGRPVEQVEFDRLLRGAGRFVGDLPEARDALQAVFVRSDVAAGRIVSIDVSAARRAPGVVAALTGVELAQHVAPIAPLSGPPDERFAAALSVESHARHVLCLAVDVVRYVGEPVAVVVAVDRYLAEDAAQLVVAQYEPTEPVIDAERALCDGTPRVHPDAGDNVALRMSFERGDLAAVPEEDATVVESTYRIGRQTAVSIECRGVLARPAPTGGLDVWSSTQVPFLVQRTIARATGWDPDTIEVRGVDVGGGFGPKAVVYGEEVVVAFLADSLGRSVTWLEDRYESQVAASQARDQVHRPRLVVSPGGEILSWQDEFLVDLGTHNPWLLGVAANTALHLLGPYRIPAVRITGTGVYTNKAPTSQYRGAGRPEACFVLERSLDAAADRLGIDRLELRERNILGPDDLPYEQHVPYRDGVDVVYDGRDYAKVLAEAADLIPDAEIADRRRELEASRRVGRGVAVYMEATARGPREPESARIGVLPDGRLLVRAASGPSGQGHETMLAQIAADVAARSMGDVEVVTAGTDGLPGGLGTFASRTAVIVGSALHAATAELVDAAAAAVRRVCDGGEVVHVPGGFDVDGGDRHVTWADVASYFADGGPLADASPLDVLHTFAPPTVTWTMGAHAALVAVDEHSGAVEVLAYGVAHEGGPAINSRIVDGQIRGGVAQGIGGALFEEVRYDAAGQPVTVTLADYLIPAAPELSSVRLRHEEVASELNPLGIRGVGESGVIASAPALAAAVEDALDVPGLRVERTPFTAEYLIGLIAGAT